MLVVYNCIDEIMSTIVREGILRHLIQLFFVLKCFSRSNFNTLVGRLESVCELGISAAPAPGAFWRTQMLTLMPRYVLVNECDDTLVYVQESSAVEKEGVDSSVADRQLLLLSPNEQVIFCVCVFFFVFRNQFLINLFININTESILLGIYG